jgi:hypothetical protein
MIKIKSIRDFVKRLPQIAAERIFWSFLALFFIAAACGAILFYKYEILAKNAEPQAIETPLKLNENLYRELSDIWQKRGEALEAANTKKYADPFQK